MLGVEYVGARQRLSVWTPTLSISLQSVRFQSDSAGLGTIARHRALSNAAGHFRRRVPTRHLYFPSRSPCSASHTIPRGSSRSPRLSIFPRSAPNIVFGRFRYGTNRATGFPRFVITISIPVSNTSSINPKHLARNSVADIVRSSVTVCPSIDTSKPSGAYGPRESHRCARPQGPIHYRPNPCP